MLLLQIKAGDIISIGEILLVFSEAPGSGRKLRIGIDDPEKITVLREALFPPELAGRANSIRGKGPRPRNSGGIVGRMREVHSLLALLLQDKNIHSAVPSAGLAVREIAEFLDTRANKGGGHA